MGRDLRERVCVAWSAGGMSELKKVESDSLSAGAGGAPFSVERLRPSAGSARADWTEGLTRGTTVAKAGRGSPGGGLGLDAAGGKEGAARNGGADWIGAGTTAGSLVMDFGGAMEEMRGTSMDWTVTAGTMEGAVDIGLKRAGWTRAVADETNVLDDESGGGRGMEVDRTGIGEEGRITGDLDRRGAGREVGEKIGVPDDFEDRRVPRPTWPTKAICWTA